MNRDWKAGITVIVAGGLVLAAWTALPALESGQHRAQRRAAEHVERARRLFDRYMAGLTHLAALGEELEAQGITVPVDELEEPLIDEYQQIHSVLWESYPPHDWTLPTPRPKRANYGNVPGQIREALDRFADEAGVNERWLTQAMQEVDQAVRIAAQGGAPAGDAMRLKGAILYQQGLIRLVRARLRRLETEEQLRRAWKDLAEATADARLAGLAERSGIDDKIADLKQRLADLQAERDKTKQDLDQVEARLADLRSRLAAAEQRRDRAHRRMEDLQTRGVDFSDPQGASHFKQAYLEAADAYRLADREARALRFGTYPNARLEVPGEYLDGRYVEEGGDHVAVEFGLTHFENKQAVLSASLVRQEQAIEEMRQDLERLTQLRERYETIERQADARRKTLRDRLRDALAEMDELLADIEATEDEALDRFDRAAEQFRRAAGQVDRWIRDARDKTADLSPEAKQRSAYNPRLQDEWRGGFALAGAADAQMAAAFIHAERYHTRKERARLFKELHDLLGPVEGLDPQAEQAGADAAREAGTQAVTDAVDALKQVHRKTGQPWTVSAQAAGATYLLVLLGHADFVKDAVEAYRTALKGREDAPEAAVFADRLADLEAR